MVDGSGLCDFSLSNALVPFVYSILETLYIATVLKFNRTNLLSAITLYCYKFHI